MPQRPQFSLEQLDAEIRRREQEQRFSLEELDAEIERRRAEEVEATPGLLSEALSGAGEGFMRNQPLQNPFAAGEEIASGGIGGLIGGLLSGQAQTLGSGLNAALNPAAWLQDPGKTALQTINLPLGMIPAFGPAVSQEAVEPAAQAFSMEQMPDAERARLLGQSAGAAGGLAADVALDRGVGMIGSALRPRIASAVASGREAAQKAATGIPESLGRRPGAGFAWQGLESLVSRLPGGKGPIDAFREMQQMRIVENGINKALQGMADFTGPKAVLTHRIRNGVNNIIDNLQIRNRDIYSRFDRELEASNMRLGERGLPTRAQRARGVGGDEVTGIVPESMAGASAPSTPSGVKVTSFAGDAVADVADDVMSQVGAERLLIKDPSLEGLVGKVKKLKGLRGKQIPVTVATDARSTLLQLARRLDNPLGSKEGRVVAKVFDPIDTGIENALRGAGGEQLVSQWRTANARVRRAHDIIDDSLFAEVAKMRDPENIATAFREAPQMDLRRMENMLEPELWDQVRTLAAKDQLAKSVVGESALPARRTGKPLVITLDKENPVKVTGNLNEAMNTFEETKRGVFFDDDFLQEISDIEAVRGRANIPDQMATLIGSQLGASAAIGVPAAVGGFLLGGGALPAVGTAAGVLGTMVIGAKAAADLITHPEIWDNFRANAMSGVKKGSQAARGQIGAGIIGQQIVNGLSDEALAEFISLNRIPVSSLPEDIKKRLFKPGNNLAKFGMIDARGPGR